MSLKKDFQQFVFRGNVVDLAVGVIIGAAFGKIVTAVVDDLVMPIIAAFQPDGDWRKFDWEPYPKMKFMLGHFAATVIDFVIVATVLFIVLVKLVGFLNRKPAPPPPPATKACKECLETIPEAARRCKFCTSVVAALLLLLLPAQGFSQEPVAPKFQYAKSEERKGESQVEKKLQAKGGLVVLSGNSQAVTGTLGATGSYQAGWNRLSLEASGAYVRSRLRTAVEQNMMAGIQAEELVDQNQTTSRLFQAKGRYDRFFTTNNAVYASAQALTDTPAGKELVAGGQVGYSRQLYKDERHRAVAEVGYDLSYQRAAAPGAQGVGVHSARLYLSEDLKLSEATGLFVNGELLTNLNAEREPVTGFEAIHGKVAALDDTRAVARAGVSTTLWQNVSFAFSFGLRYDNAPSPRKAPTGFSFDPAFMPLADKLDTTTEASLVVTFL